MLPFTHGVRRGRTVPSEVDSLAGKVVSIEDRIPKLKQQRRKKTNRKILMFIVLFFLLLLVVAYFYSPLSRVGQITVTGQEAVSEETVIEKSGITDKDLIWTLQKKKIRDALQSIPEIKSVSIRLKYPNRLFIHVKEYERIALVKSGNRFYSLLENGGLSANTEGIDGPVLSGFDGSEKRLKSAAGQLKKIRPEIRNSISEMIYAPKETDANRVVLYMNDSYEVHGTLRTLAEKMNYYPDLVKQIDPKVKGVIDLEVGLFFQPYHGGSNGEDGETGEN